MMSTATVNSPKASKGKGAPKAKGAVRAKSGCYTCRIRRKKCDEKPDDRGHCQTCVRLRLECLGFGAKRPDWLRDHKNVNELRDKIKSHLSAQGLIKGQSGTGQRTSTPRDPDILRLNDDDTSSASPPTPTLSLDHQHRYGGMATHAQTSSVRGSPYNNGAAPTMLQHQDSYGVNQTTNSSSHSGGSPTWSNSPYDQQPEVYIVVPQTQGYAPDSPRQPFYPHDIMLPHYSAPVSTNSLVSPASAASNWSSNHSYAPGGPSTFGPWYTKTFALEEDEYGTSPTSATAVSPNTHNNNHQNNMYTSTNPLTGAPVGMNALIPSTDLMTAYLSSGQFFAPMYSNFDNEQLLDHYLDKVLDIQYLLATPDIQYTLRNTIKHNFTAQQAVALLAAVHRSRTLYKNADGELSVASAPRYNEVRRQLIESDATRPEKTYDDGTVMAALHVVSAFLFNGGIGEWDRYIQVACELCAKALGAPYYSHATDILLRCSDAANFNIKTTMWFDILGAASRCAEPHFIHVYRAAFKPSPDTARINGSYPSPPDRLSMLPVMGCENQVAWALAEISSLACWKANQTALGRLSYPALCARGREIEQVLSVPSQFDEGRISTHLQTREGAENRYLTSEIFRASAQVYLHSVLSGDYPSCPEIRQGVADTIAHLNQVQVPDSQARTAKRNRSVVRSVVFSIFICGCLTDDQEQRTFLWERLVLEESESVGNCEEVKNLMSQVWQARRTADEPVPWRDYLKRSGLLLV